MTQHEWEVFWLFVALGAIWGAACSINRTLRQILTELQRTKLVDVTTYRDEPGKRVYVRRPHFDGPDR